MKCEIKSFNDPWQIIKDSTLTTIGKERGIYPDSNWKIKMLMCEHSPIRIGEFILKLYGIPTFVSTHFVRHKIGVEHFISTNRDDRGGSDNITRDTPVDMTMKINFQALINISRKRLCKCSHAKTIEVWNMILEEIKKYEPELYKCCVRECVYRGFCAEFKSCGYDLSLDYQEERNGYCNNIRVNT